MEEDKDLEILQRICQCRRFSGVYTDVECIFKAIENLLLKYKELEEENRKLTARKYMLNAETGELKEIPIDNNYIPKSKVKEILNKLSNHNYKCNFDDVDFLQNIIIEIHQLLED